MSPYYIDSHTTIYHGDALTVLRELPAASVNCCVTSPPYWGLRDYGIPGRPWGCDPDCDHVWGDEVVINATNHTGKTRWNHTRNGRDEEQPPEKRVSWLRTKVKQGQFCQKCGAWFGALGLEPTPDLFVAHVVEVFAAVREVMTGDGTLWLNLGDSYHGSWGNSGNRPELDGKTSNQREKTAAYLARGGWDERRERPPSSYKISGLKPKDLVGIPWAVAFALREDGWYLRSDIIWAKPNPMPESVTDRPTKAHEYFFLLAKSEKYYFDADSFKEPGSGLSGGACFGKVNQDGPGARRVSKEENDRIRGKKQRKPAGWDTSNGAHGSIHRDGRATEVEYTETDSATRNRRSVWSIPTHPYPGAHFATFPPKLIEPCILAGCPEGGTVIDPFLGSGTTAQVARDLGRKCVGIELNEAYIKLAMKRLRQKVLSF